MLCASFICVRSEFRNEEDILCIKVKSRGAAGETGGEMRDFMMKVNALITQNVPFREP